MTGDPEYIISEAERAEPENQGVKLNICMLFLTTSNIASQHFSGWENKTCKKVKVKKKLPWCSAQAELAGLVVDVLLCLAAYL